MKTVKNLYRHIISFENILEAYYKAAKGKREKKYVMDFTNNLEENIIHLQKELEQKTYKPGKYSTFEIYKPKPRMISAASFRDRVVHHMLMNKLGPIIEKKFIYDSYANRIGKGTHKAIKKYQYFLKRYHWVLKCDIKKFFPTVDHEILKCLFKKQVKDEDTLWLIETLIDNSNKQEFVCDYFPGDTLLTPIERRKGLPIGNLTSQWFGNFLLNYFDHFVKEKLRCQAYVRYVDDFVLFSDSKEMLKCWLEEITRFLETIRLCLNKKQVHLFPARIGYNFLGQVIFRSVRRLPGKNVRSFRRRFNKWEKQNSILKNKQRIAAWTGHAKQADTKGLLQCFNF